MEGSGIHVIAQKLPYKESIELRLKSCYRVLQGFGKAFWWVSSLGSDLMSTGHYIIIAYSTEEGGAMILFVLLL